MKAIEIFKELELSAVEKKSIENALKLMHFSKGDSLLRPNESVDYQYFVVEGCMRSFYIDEHRKEHTVQFAIKDWWISDYTAFFTKGKSIMFVECIQDTTVYRLSRKDMEELCQCIRGLEKFFRVKSESFISAFQRRILQDHSKTAAERYADFIQTYPEIEKLVKKYHIASYLGIAGATLSRIPK